MKKTLYNLLFLIVSGMFFLGRSPVATAAEKVSFRYSLLEFSIPVDSLRTYAETGEVDHYLNFYLQSSTPQELEDLRELLTYNIDLNSITLYRFFNTSIGENILKNLGGFIQPTPTQNGLYSLRSALIMAAREPDGLNLLNFLRQFPSQTIYVNGENSLELAYNFVKLIEQTQQAIATVERQANIAAKSESQADFSQQLDLRKLGRFTWKQKTLTFNDTQRDRSFSAELYRPQTNTFVPVVVISPGLGADGDNFAYLARHLASHGLAAITVNHPGSDRLRVENFFQGKNREIIEVREFIDRPKDISFLLDELQLRQSNTSLNSRLNLELVGIIGHSFGGSTALALAGAKYNLPRLQSYCQAEAKKPDLFNPSLVFQCLAAELSTSKNIPLSDSRIKAVFALNPMVSNIFGQSGLSQVSVPVTLVAGSEDFITPALIEQIVPFTWLENPNKYLLLIEKGHTYNDAENLKVNKNQPVLIHQEYFQAISLAFMQSYLTNNNYQKFLSSSYAKSIADRSLKLNLIDSLKDYNLQEFKY